MKKDGLLQKFLKYAAMNIIGMLGLSCYILADTFYVSKALGAQGLAALNLAIGIYSVIHAAGLMLGVGGATKYGFLKKQNKDSQANGVFTQTLYIGLFVGVIFLVAGLFFACPLASFLGADAASLPLTGVYLSVILCFAPFFILNNIIIAFVRNDKNPKLAMAAMLIGSFSNIILDYVFMFPLKMGMFGAAFATGLSPVISLCVLSIHFIKKKNRFKPVKCAVSFKALKALTSLGVSTFITEISSAVVLILFNFIILNLRGNIGVAAYGVVANLSLVALSVFVGVAQGIQPLITARCALGDIKALKSLAKYAAAAALVCAVVLYSTVFFFTDGIVSVFNSGQNAVLADLARNGIRTYFTGLFFAGFNIIFSAFLSAAQKPKSGFLISFTRGVAAIIPLVFILSSLFGITGVWLSFVLAEGITLLISAVRSAGFFRRKQ